jgi:hypothetical protein
MALGLAVALVLDVVLGLWPVVLQRYNPCASIGLSIDACPRGTEARAAPGCRLQMGPCYFTEWLLSDDGPFAFPSHQ